MTKPKSKSKQSQVESIVASLESHLIQLRKLAPAGYADKKHDGNAEMSTWRSAINTLEGAFECVDDVAADLKYRNLAPEEGG